MAASTKPEGLYSRRPASGRKYSRREFDGDTRLFTRSPFPILLIDIPTEGEAPLEGREPRVVDVNPAAVDFFEAGGKAGLIWSLPRALALDTKRILGAIASEEAGSADGGSYEAAFRTIRGARRSAIVHCSLDSDRGYGIARVALSLRDTTALRRAEAVEEARLALLDRSLTLGLRELLQISLDEAEELTESRIGFFHLVDEDGSTVVLQNWSTRTKEVFCKAAGSGLHYDIAEAGIWVECARTGRPTIYNDYASLPGRKGLPPGHAELIRELVVPVIRGGRVAAILGVGNKESPYDELDSSSLSKLADFAWEIAERKRSEETLRCLATSFSAKAGRDFFDSASRRLAEELRAEGALIASWPRGSGSLKVLGDSLGKRARAIGAIPLGGGGSAGARSADAARAALERGIRGLEAFGNSSLFAEALALAEDGTRVVLAGFLYSRIPSSRERVEAVLALYKDRIMAEAARSEAERSLEKLNARLEDQVRERSLELERAAKLAMLGRLVAGIAHEMSTPLAAISSANESLSDSIARCVPGLSSFLHGAGDAERELFSRLIGVMLEDRGRLSEAELRARKRRWRALAAAAGIEGAEGAIDMLADIGDDPAEEELIRMLRAPLRDEVIGKAFLICRSLRTSSIIKAATEKATRTVRALKTYAHEAPSDLFEEISLEESLRETLELYYSTDVAADISVACEPTPPVLAQPDRLSQVWANLLSNAIHASRGRARIEIAVRREGSSALVSVADDGPGIAEEAREHIFTPFYTTKPPGEGLGLGLDICRRIVEEAGGGISYVSAPGRTVFTVSLPLARGGRL